MTSCVDGFLSSDFVGNCFSAAGTTVTGVLAEDDLVVLLELDALALLTLLILLVFLLAEDFFVFLRFLLLAIDTPLYVIILA